MWKKRHRMKMNRVVIFLLVPGILLCGSVLVFMGQAGGGNRYTVSFKKDHCFFQDNDLEIMERSGLCFSYQRRLYPQISNGFRAGEAQVVATNENQGYFAGMHMTAGSFFNTAQICRKLPVAVLNQSAAYGLFGNLCCVGETIFLDQREYRVVGIGEEEREEESKTARIYVPYETVTAQEIPCEDCGSLWCETENSAEISLVIGKMGYEREEVEVGKGIRTLY